MSLNLYAQDIMIMGGKEHDVFLGYLNTGPRDSKSIWNKFGNYRQRSFDESILNTFGEYGSKFGNIHLLIDLQTANESKYNRAELKVTNFIIKNVDKIRGNLDDYYELLFEE